MNGEYRDTLKDVSSELLAIRKWVNKNISSSYNRYLISYATIRACGMIEIIFKNILFDYLTINANREACSYLEHMVVDSSANPSTGVVTKFLEEINPQWAEAFKDKIKTGNIKADINSLVRLRNDFAHGKDNVTSSIETIMKYFKSGVKMLKILYDIIVHRQT